MLQKTYAISPFNENFLGFKFYLFVLCLFSFRKMAWMYYYAWMEYVRRYVCVCRAGFVSYDDGIE